MSRPRHPVTTMRRLLPLLLLLLALAGCGSTEARERIPAPGPSDLLVVFHRSGGLGGTSNRLYVRPDGAARREVKGKRAKVFTMPPATLDRLREALKKADIPGLAADKDDSPPTCADCFEYSLLYEGYRLHYDETRVPPRLRPAQGILNGLAGPPRSHPGA